MAEHNNLRRRANKESNTDHRSVQSNEEGKHDSEFQTRESPLTVLIGSSLHIRAIYHIFVVILLMLFFDTAIYDLVERGKITVGVTTVIYGFGNIKRCAKLWLYEMSVAVALYPAVQLYVTVGRKLHKIRGLWRFWQMLGLIGLVIFQVALVAIPVYDLSREHLAIASSVTVTLEMFRIAMKMHAFAISLAPRCHTNLSLPRFQHFIYFLFAPTLLYRDKYPRTKKVRWSVVVFHLLEVAAIIFYNSFLWERFILPYWSDYGKQPTIEAGRVVRGMFACVLPGVISFLCGFYCVLHAWLNAFAELLTFGDRLFYEEWWTTSQFARYYRAWNRVVHSWLRDHIYKPLVVCTNRAFATFAVFFISAIAHEVVIALSFGFFYPVLLIQFGLFGVLLLPLTANSGRRYPNVFNLLMWLSFFLGNGLLWSLYSMEFFARKNCPSAETDSFFIPKSWSCPEIVLKPNWKFQNPIELFD